jgi:hypothetical protein
VGGVGDRIYWRTGIKTNASATFRNEEIKAHGS